MRRQRLASCCAQCGHLSPRERSCAARCALLVESCVECLCHRSGLLFMDEVSADAMLRVYERTGCTLLPIAFMLNFASVLQR